MFWGYWGDDPTSCTDWCGALRYGEGQTMKPSSRFHCEYGVKLKVLPNGDIVAMIDREPLEDEEEVVIAEEATLP